MWKIFGVCACAFATGSAIAASVELTVTARILPVARLSLRDNGDVNLKTWATDTKGWSCTHSYAEGEPVPPKIVIAGIPCVAVKVPAQATANGLAPFKGVTLLP